ncbi:MAG: helix-turn-helix domain-containing protein [Salipiger thiooxidans]|uniref:helix-turn-helix domain-containing protein n=1 Tax=Salipiger thiooxidans TaxID=282683 RepID=UPI00299E432A|nr:LysR family transcriptional regulator [Salipiger thiooxidans]
MTGRAVQHSRAGPAGLQGSHARARRGIPNSAVCPLIVAPSGWFCAAVDTSFDLDPLGAFLVLGESGAFGTTGRHLALPQPALMRRTLKLEDALGLRLFDRTTASVPPALAVAPGRNSAISHTAQQAPARTAASSGESATKRKSGPSTGDAAEIPARRRQCAG